MKTVLIDTNIILWTFNGGPDFREAVAEAVPGTIVAIPSCVISELKKLGTKEKILKKMTTKIKCMLLRSLKLVLSHP